MRIPTVRSLLIVVALLLGMFLRPTAAQAQPGSCGGGPCVTITPASGTYDRNVTPPADTVIAIDIHFCHPTTINWATRSIQLNGVSIAGSLSHNTSPPTGCTYGGRSWGNITLQRANEGTNNLDVTIEDALEFFGGASETYVYLWPGYTRPAFQVGVAPTPPTIERLAGASGLTASFSVTNEGSRPDSFNITVSCAVGLSCARTSAARIGLDTTAVGRTQTATLTFTAGSAGDTNQVRLVATSVAYPSGSRDTATMDVMVVGPEANGTPGLVLARRTDLRMPGLCLSFPAGRGAGSTCGDVVLAHSLPGVITRNTARAPGLVYNSDLARPNQIVAADLTLPNDGQTPTTVEARLWVNGTQRSGTSSWTGSAFPPGKTRRVAVAFDATNDSTGVYSFLLETRRIYSGSTVADTLTGELLLVNRNGSEYGAGWWVGGVERLRVISGGRRLWIGGDGSAKIYTSPAANVWVGPALAGPDTITYDGSTWYTRRLADGTKVQYSTIGLHRRTVSRLSDTTFFNYDDTLSTAKLIKIGVPRWAHDSTFRFNYTSGKLSSVTSPGPTGTARTTTFTVTSGDLVKIKEPAGDSVMFTYGTSTLARRVLTRRDRLGNVHHFRYGYGARIAADSLPTSSGVAAAIVTRYTTAETKGLSTLGTALHPDSAYTSHDGPRTDVTDVTRFWVNNLGAPTRIRNALGREQTVVYDSQWPALAASTRSASGAQQLAWYNARGLVDSTHARHLRAVNDSVSRRLYSWHATLPLPLKIVAGAGGGPDTVLTQYAYAANGNVIWTQLGTNSSARDSIFYWGSGAAKDLYQSSSSPVTSVRDTVAYDATYGNAIRSRDRLLTERRTVRDGIGRIVLDSTYNGSSSWRIDSTLYDAAGRVTLTRSVGPATGYSPVLGAPGARTVPAETLWVSTAYDKENQVTHVERWAKPDSTAYSSIITYYEYDGAGRKVSELNEGTGQRQFAYDPSGNLVRQWEGAIEVTDRPLDIAFTYDALGQLLRRATIEMAYPIRDCDEFAPYGASIIDCSFVFPVSDVPPSTTTFYVPPGRQLKIAGDTATFAYDHGGRMVEADNAHARVRRTWSPGGLLLTDTAKIRTLRYMTEGSATPATDFAGHTYALTYTYDRLGRRIGLKHPDGIDPCSGACPVQRYHYEAATGRLDSLIDVRSQVFRFKYTLAGQLDSLFAPGGMIEHQVYNAAGSVWSRTVGTTSFTAIRDTIWRDEQGRIEDVHARRLADGTPQTIALRYSGLGTLVMQETLGPDRLEEFRADALGNTYSSTRYGIQLGSSDDQPEYRVHEYTSDGRLVYNGTPSGTVGFADDQQTSYGAAGRITLRGAVSMNSGGGPTRFRQEAHYYDGNGRLAVFERHTGDLMQASLTNDPAGVIERYRYDALGRRVLVHANRTSTCTVAGCDRSVRRMVWDGDQMLYEIRAPASDATISSAIESDAPSGGGLGSAANQFGRVAYTHAFGIDRPLGVVRMNGTSELLTFYPQMNWRGLYEGATKDDGSWVTNAITWPGEAASAYLGAEASVTPDEWMGSLIKEQADASGLMYRRNRYYDPAVGRFTQEDPIGLAGGMNLYGYAGGDPANNHDPFGTDCKRRTKRGEKCEEDRGEDGKEERHDVCEVADILTAYADALRTNPRRFATVRDYPGDFDWKFGATADDLFQVGDQWLRADEFGNFAAGYAAQEARGWLGRLAMFAGGVAFASFPNSGEHWSDSDSRPMIDAGARRAQEDRLASAIGGGTVRTLTNQPGCDPQ